jgi:hypothetical protein
MGFAGGSSANAQSFFGQPRKIKKMKRSRTGRKHLILEVIRSKIQGEERGISIKPIPRGLFRTGSLKLRIIPPHRSALITGAKESHRPQFQLYANSALKMKFSQNKRGQWRRLRKRGG